MTPKKTLHLTRFLESAESRDTAAGLLANGGLVVLPTETVYGLGANALDSRAVLSIFAAKGRPADNPLIVHLASVDQLDTVTSSVPEAARTLFSLFAPGPLTLVLPRAPSLPDAVTAGLGSVGIRIPSHPAAHLLLSRCGLPIAAPSANRSGRVSPTNFEMACEEMDGRVDAIIDGGQCAFGLESTVAQVTDSGVVILRPGAVTLEMIRQALPGFPVSAVADDSASSGKPVLSPGMKYAHYQPDAAVYVWTGGPLGELGDPAELGVIGLKGSLGDERAAFTREYESLEAYSSDFYSVLRDCDRLGLKKIAARAVSDEGIGRALMNRLKRASAGKTVPPDRII